MPVVEGTVAFADLDEHEVYNGRSTGKYSIVITLDSEAQEKLENEGIHLKEYQDKVQRKFATKFKAKVVDTEGEPYLARVGWGDKVRIQYGLQKPDPVHGSVPFLSAVRVLEVNEERLGAEDDEDF